MKNSWLENENEKNRIRANSNYEDLFISEQNLIDKLIATNKNKLNMDFVGNLISDPVPFEEYLKYEKYFIITGVLRHRIGFTNKTKPGDYDIIIIPASNEKIYFERTAAAEIKIARPTRSNQNKSSKSMGSTQTLGILQDGFPIVGLTHICMPESLSLEERIPMKFILGGVGKTGDKRTIEEREKFIHPVDYLPSKSAENQMRRMISAGLPKYVGLKALGIKQTKDKRFALQISLEYSRFEAAYFNPNLKKQTILKVKNFYDKNKAEFKCLKA